MNSFIKLAMLGVALSFPADTATTSDRDVFLSTDYSKYDDLVKDIPSAKRLIFLNQELDRLNDKLIKLEAKSN